MFANCQMGGQDLAPADAVTQPPPVPPIVAPNTAMGMMGVGGAMKVLLNGMPAHNLNTVIPMTVGPVGVAGAASGTVMGPSRHMTCATSVMMGEAPATRVTSVSLQNSTNAPGVRVTPGQTLVMILGK